MSKKHLQKYLGECDFRYNTKEFESESQRFDCFLQNKSAKLSYKELLLKYMKEGIKSVTKPTKKQDENKSKLT